MHLWGAENIWSTSYDRNWIGLTYSNPVFDWEGWKLSLLFFCCGVAWVVGGAALAFYSNRI